ncbi:poly-gamma-glutamate biosynthesis protein PgsC [Myxococcota bacterium]
MMELLALSVGIGLAIGLLFGELYGLAAGGMIVPGYLALHLERPADVAVTIGAGLVTFALVRALSRLVIVYGRRRTVLMILIGYLVAMAFRWVTSSVHVVGAEYQLIGFIIPGLIALCLDRQGLVETLAALVTASAVVRLILIIIVGPELRA